MSAHSPSSESNSECPNYAAVEPDPEKHPSEYSTVERRADVLDHIVSRGSPSAISQSRLAERYEVVQSTISRDVDVLGEAVNEQVGDRLRLATKALHDKLIADLSEADDWRAKQAAWSVHMEYLEWTGVSGEVADEGTTAAVESGGQDHELSDKQRENLEALREQACEQIPKCDEKVTVPVGDETTEGRSR